MFRILFVLYKRRRPKSTSSALRGSWRKPAEAIVELIRFVSVSTNGGSEPVTLDLENFVNGVEICLLCSISEISFTMLNVASTSSLEYSHCGNAVESLHGPTFA